MQISTQGQENKRANYILVPTRIKRRVDKMEWLKEILKDVENSEEIIKNIKKGIGEKFVSKEDFNNKNNEVKDLKDQLADRDRQLESLKKVDPKQLQEEIETLKESNANKQAEFEKKIHTIKVESALDKALLSSGAKNIRAVKALLDIDVENVKLDQSGNLENILTLIEGIKTSDPYLFESDGDPQKGFTGAEPGTGAQTPPQKADSEKSYEDFVREIENN
jgi:phage minor structural protein GP20